MRRTIIVTLLKIVASAETAILLRETNALHLVSNSATARRLTISRKAARPPHIVNETTDTGTRKETTTNYWCIA